MDVDRSPDTATRLAALPTPCLVLNEARMGRNIERLEGRARALGVVLRPHLKTSKSLDVARRMLTGGDGPATVSTLVEAEMLASAGVRDILYAVGIAPQKLDRVLALRRRGCDLTVILDSVEQAAAVAAASRDAREALPALVEIDCDGHRGGVRPDDPSLLRIGRALGDGGAELRGVMTHAGGSYGAVGRDHHALAADGERAAAVAAAQALRAGGLPCRVVSVGSTPTAHAAANLTGVTELRAGVYVFFDLVMAGLGACRLEDIALSVLTTVIGRQPGRGLLIDAGWMALSRDRGTASQATDQGYGLVCDEAGLPLDDLIVSRVSQEHGIVTPRSGAPSASLPDLPVGTRLRILPNHACATAAQHQAYQVEPAEPGAPLAVWPRFSGW